MKKEENHLINISGLHRTPFSRAPQKLTVTPAHSEENAHPETSILDSVSTNMSKYGFIKWKHMHNSCSIIIVYITKTQLVFKVQFKAQIFRHG